MVLVIGGMAALGFVLAAYRFSTRLAGHVTLATALLWTTGLALLELNARIYPVDETLRETGEAIAILPIVVALPLSLLSILLILTGMNRQR